MQSLTFAARCIPLALLAGCAAAGARDFEIGQSLEAKGDVEAAHAAYARAARAAPSNPSYRSARDQTGAALAESVVEQARAEELDGQWEAAARSWGRAAELVPSEPDYAANAALANARTADLGVLDWYEAAAGVSEQFPTSESAKTARERASKEAYTYHVALGREALSRRAGKEALEHFSAAREFDPETPGLSLDTFDEAEAWALAETAESEAAAGDAMKAYETYRAAYAKKAIPEIRRAMRSVKARAGAILAKLERARNLAEKRRFESALRLYSELLENPGIPDQVADEAAAIRDDLVRDGAEDARRLADRGNLRAARRKLESVIPHLDLPPENKQTVRGGVALIMEGSPADGLLAVDEAGLAEGSPIRPAIKALAVGEGRQQVRNARRISRRNSAKALTILAKLSSLEEDLPEIETLRRSLQSEAFDQLLTDAVRAARKGDDVEAAAALQAALSAGEGDEAVQEPAKAALAALKAGQYAEAQRSFRTALAAAPRSRFAREGERVAEIRRIAAEREALAALRTESPRSSQAVEVLAAGLSLSPSNPSVRQGRALLEDRLEAADRRSDAEIAELIGWLALLYEMDEEARGKVEEGADLLEAGRFEAAETAFLAAGSHPVARRGQSLARARLVGGLEASAATAQAGSEASADAIAALLSRDAKDPSALRALEDLFSKAEAAAAARNDGEAARFLELATRATRPSKDVQAALTRGHKALATGNVGEAGAAYAEAKKLSPRQPVAVRAEALARRLDAQVLSSALGSGQMIAARAALQRTIEREPSGAAAAQALRQLFGSADRAVDEGRFGEASELLEVANVATKPEALRAAVSAANKLLAQQKLPEAVKAYDAALAQGSSAVAERGRAAAQRSRMAGLVASANALKTGTAADPKAAAVDVRTLLRLDPTRVEGRNAVSAVLDRGATAAERGDAEGVASALQVAALALGQTTVTQRALDFVRRGKLAEAEKSFTQNDGALAERGPKIVSSLRIRSLKSGLAAGGLEAAKSIRDLLRANPNDPTARQAFDALVERVESSARLGEASAAAAALREANVASAAGEALTAAVDAGARPLAEARFADAELLFARADKNLPKSEVVEAGLAAARVLRAQAESAAIEGLTTAEDPRKHAEVLVASRKADPSAPALKKGLAAALARARAAADAGDRNLLARSLAAAGRLEASTEEGAVAMVEASELVASGKLVEAEEAYAALLGEVASAGQKLVRAVRILEARTEVEKAAKAGRLLDEAQAVKALLLLAPGDRSAQARASRLSKEVKASRVAAAQKQIDQGKPGVAWLYLDRALTLDESDRGARSLKEKVEKDLDKRKDLIIVVEAVRRDGVPGSRCRKLDVALQSGLMESLSKRTDLNGYVLSASWTEAWRKKDSRAPAVTGGLSILIKDCIAGSGSGKVTFGWSVESPKGGKKTAEGEVSAEVKQGSLLVDEQDGAGNNVRRLLVERSVEAVVEGLKAESSKVRQWLLTSAEQALAEGRPEAAADAYARYRMRPVKSADPARSKKIRAALDSAFP